MGDVIAAAVVSGAVRIIILAGIAPSGAKEEMGRWDDDDDDESFSSTKSALDSIIITMIDRSIRLRLRQTHTHTLLDVHGPQGAVLVPRKVFCWGPVCVALGVPWILRSFQTIPIPDT